MGPKQNCQVLSPLQAMCCRHYEGVGHQETSTGVLVPLHKDHVRSGVWLSLPAIHNA
uniref:Uncharacterized protein n=1 Tax=Anguilla anguilla TaxID=7936 RepID=A0A0E9XK03_ANGAN